MGDWFRGPHERVYLLAGVTGGFDVLLISMDDGYRHTDMCRAKDWGNINYSEWSKLTGGETFIKIDKPKLVRMCNNTEVG